ncbi:ankyrin repeat, PH and SEC7 domain containing protein [Candidatus Magnetomorum sp. HK-1]|nr:ankyrin repeat, PH and SEC7 domain containing protein [Candidatus Magnetomorum sp. HK-1]
MFKYIVTLICFWIINIGYIYANTSINNNFEDKIKDLIIKHLSIKETISIDKLVEPYSTEKIFFHAVSYGHIDIVKQLVKDINMKQLRESLNIAIINGYDNIAKSIIKQGLKVNYSIDSGTPLGIASSKGNLTIVKQLLDAGAKYDIKDNDNKMPIYLAIDNNQLNIIKHFIKSGIDINSFKTPETPLIYALKNGKVDITNFLLESGAKYNNSDLEGLMRLYSDNHSILKDLFQTNIPFDVNYVQGGCSCGSSGECYCDYTTPIHTALRIGL